MPITVATAGLHPTTECCLEAMQWLHNQPEYSDFSNILDIGCGSGILSLAAAGIWDAQVLAADISPNAVADITQNIASHELETAVRAIRSDGFTHPNISKNAPYDFIIINLLAKQLVEMSPSLASHLAENGIALLSGMLVWLTPAVKQVYEALGFEIIKEISRTPWQTMLLRKRCLS